jgi:hypothetical protein
VIGDLKSIGHGDSCSRVVVLGKQVRGAGRVAAGSSKAIAGAIVGAKSGRSLVARKTGRGRNLEGHINSSVLSSQLGFRRAELHVRGRCAAAVVGTKVEAENTGVGGCSLHEGRVDAASSNEGAGAHSRVTDDRSSS